MDAYFASVEQKDNPFLRGKPMVVVADPHRRSVVLTSSYEARAFGVKTGMVLWQAKVLCPWVLVVSGHAEKYRETSRSILQILLTFTDRVEMTSCDEAFLDVTGSQRLFGDGRSIAAQIKAKLQKDLGLGCSVGVAPNKLLAKLAAEKEKPNGLTVFTPETIPNILERTAVEKLCGIGEKARTALERLGVKTCGELGRASLWVLYEHFGFWAHHLKRMGQGKDDSPVARPEDQEPLKSVGHSHTFPKDTDDPNILLGYLELLAEKVAARLRRYGSSGRSLALTWRRADFHTFTRHLVLGEPTDQGAVIYQAAKDLLERQKPFGQPLRLLGVSLSDLETKRKDVWLFEALEKREALSKTMDEVNARYGPLTLKPARILSVEQFGVLETPIPPHLRL